MISNLQCLPEWSHAWALQRLQQHTAAGQRATAGEWTKLGAWLSVLPSHRPKMPGKLHKLTLLQAISAAKRYHAGREALSAAFPGDAGAVETVCGAERNGWRWVKILSPEGLDYEGNAMGHCIGGGDYDDADTVIFSLRDPRNIPHCTIEWDEDCRCVTQVQGHGSGEVSERYHGAVASFVRGLNPVKVEFSGKFAHFFSEGELKHYTSLTAGTRIPGNLDLSYCSLITELPNGIIIEGSLLMYKCGNLRRLPDNLSPGGDTVLRECTSLEYLPDDFTAGGSLNITGCTSLKALPGGLNVGNTLWAGDCRNLTGLPDDMRVNSDVSISGCTAIKELKTGFTVNGNFYMSECTGLDRLPYGMRVFGYMDARNCTGLTELPDDLYVQANMNTQGCTGLLKSDGHVRKNIL